MFILKNISIGIANLLIDLMNYNLNSMNQKKNFLNEIYTFANNNMINNTKNRIESNPPKKKKINISFSSQKDNEKKGENSNIIYYDENRKMAEIFNDSKLFERIISNGCFILATNEKSLNLIIDEIQKSNYKEIKFDLIVTGTQCKKILNLLGDKKKNLFKSGCIYTKDYKKIKK